MPKIVFIEASGKEHVVDAKLGESVMQAATSNMVPGILADCGGSCTCATCHAYLDERWADKLPPAGEDEIAMIEGALDTRPTSRLTCQIKITDALDGAVFVLPASQY
ncbi:MAG: 2Fe-2S iron-sulfur cluster-binding protein [Panacagrimonas sp.]